MPQAGLAQESGVLRLFLDRGGAFGEECLRGAFERAKQRLCPYMIDAARPDESHLLKDRMCLGVAGMLNSSEIRKILKSAPFPAIT